MQTVFLNNKRTYWEIIFFAVTMFRHHFTNSCFSMTVAPSQSVWLCVGRGFRLCLNKFCPKKLGTFPGASSSGDRKGQGERASLWLWAVLQSSRTYLYVEGTRVTAAQKLVPLVSKGSAACLAVSGASVLEKSVLWELDFYYYCFQSGSACCWKVAQTFNVLWQADWN